MNTAIYRLIQTCCLAFTLCWVDAVAQQGVGLTDNVYAIGSPGTSIPSPGGINATGDAYAGNLVGTAVTWSGMTFTLAGPGPRSGLSNTSVPVPTGQYQSLSVLATGVRGNQPNQIFVVTYSDGVRSASLRV